MTQLTPPKITVNEHVAELDTQLRRASEQTRWADHTVITGLQAGDRAVSALRHVVNALEDLEYPAALTVYNAVLAGLDGR